MTRPVGLHDFKTAASAGFHGERTGWSCRLARDGWLAAQGSHHVHQSHSRADPCRPVLVRLWWRTDPNANLRTCFRADGYPHSRTGSGAYVYSYRSADVHAGADTFFVDPSHDLGPISKYVYGTNYGPWVSLRPETLRDAYYGGLTIIRWPGGEWGDKTTSNLTRSMVR